MKQIDEKLITFGSNDNYGNIIFLAGGGGSGKGYAIRNYIDEHKYKIRDVDEFKRLMIDMAKRITPEKEASILKSKPARTPEDFEKARNANLGNPEDVFAMHDIVKRGKLKNTSAELLFKDTKPDRLPNVIMDVTMKDLDDVLENIPYYEKAGYDPKKIHIVWVMAQYAQALENNRGRKRVVPEEVLLGTHEGAAHTMVAIIHGNVPHYIDGGIAIIWPPAKDESGKTVDKSIRHKSAMGGSYTESFEYITLKKPGQPIDPSAVAKTYDALLHRIPQTDDMDIIRDFLTKEKKTYAETSPTLREWMKFINEEV